MLTEHTAFSKWPLSDEDHEGGVSPFLLTVHVHVGLSLAGKASHDLVPVDTSPTPHQSCL